MFRCSRLVWLVVLATLLAGRVSAEGTVQVDPDPGLADCGIQAAIDEVASTGGGTVVLPAGRFPLARSLVLRSGVTLAGQGDTTILAAAVDERRAAVAAGLPPDAGSIELAGDLSSLVPGRTIILWPRGIRSHPKHRAIATVTSVAGSTVTLESPFGSATGDNAFVAWGLWTTVAAAASAGDRSVRVADPAIFSAGTGIKLTGPGDTWDHHWNHVERIEGDTLHLARPLSVAPAAGSVAQRMHSLVTAEGVTNVGIRDLVLEGFPDKRKPAGGAFYLAALHTHESRTIAVRHVVVRDWHSDAFSFQNGADLVVEDCTATGNFGHGFHPGTGFERAEFVRIRSTGNASDGFYYCWHNHRVDVRDSTLTDNGGHGVGGLGIPGDSENVVEGNRIEGNGLAGVEMRGGGRNHGNTVANNTIRDNSRAAPGRHPGILIAALWAESPSGAIVRGNVIESTRAEPTQWIGIEEVHAPPRPGKEDRADPEAGLVLVDASTIEGNRVAGHKTADIVVRGRSTQATGNEGRVVEERP
jgi:parallel beta-helix repeat protein